MKKAMVLCLVIGTILALLITGCATPQKTGQVMQAVAVTAPTIAHQLDAVYATLIDAQALPAHQDVATFWLGHLDAIAPMVQSQGAALAGDQFNWAAFVIQAAIAAVRVWGLWQ